METFFCSAPIPVHGKAPLTAAATAEVAVAPAAQLPDFDARKAAKATRGVARLVDNVGKQNANSDNCLLYTSPSPRD